MSTLIKRMIVLTFITLLVSAFGVGCNTARGFGKDVSNTGDAIQDGAK